MLTKFCTFWGAAVPNKHRGKIIVGRRVAGEPGGAGVGEGVGVLNWDHAQQLNWDLAGSTRFGAGPVGGPGQVCGCTRVH